MDTETEVTNLWHTNTWHLDPNPDLNPDPNPIRDGGHKRTASRPSPTVHGATSHTCVAVVNKLRVGKGASEVGAGGAGEAGAAGAASRRLKSPPALFDFRKDQQYPIIKSEQGQDYGSYGVMGVVEVVRLRGLYASCGGLRG